MSEKEIIARRGAEFIAALNRQDIPVLSAMRAEDCIDIPPNRPPIRGLSAIQAFWREGFAQVETRFTGFPDQLEISGDIAVDRFRWTAESAPLSGGPAAHDEGICVWVWRREKDGAWKIAQAIWNSDLPQGQTVWTGAAPPAASQTDLGAGIRAANEDLLTKGNIARAREIFSPDYRVHFNGEVLRGTQAIEQYVTELRAAFPDLRYEIEILASAGDKVSWVRTHHGTHTGNFMGAPPSGRSITWRDSVVSRYEGDRIAEEWAVTDIGEQLRK